MSGTVIQFGLESQFRILLPEEEFEQLFELLMTDFTLPCALSTVTGNTTHTHTLYPSDTLVFPNGVIKSQRRIN